jgi:hypothetical protein
MSRGVGSFSRVEVVRVLAKSDVVKILELMNLSSSILSSTRIFSTQKSNLRWRYLVSLSPSYLAVDAVECLAPALSES